jgi:H/ACA ribonucleoprotein complex non-core subunit NAF1
MDNMPRWLEDIKNGVDRDLDDDACHAEPPRTKNEIPAETRPPPPPPPPVAPDEAIVPIGDVVSVVGDVVVVQSLPNTPPLDEESILCLETRQGLAAIEEVFGPVAAPLYAFRAPSEVSGEGAEGGADTAVLPDDVKVGTRIYVVEGRSRVIQTAGLYSKGYDNSGQNDEEVDDDEYSDDEKEAEAKKQRKQKKRGADGAGKGGPSAMRDGGLAAAAAAAGMGAGMPHYGNGPSRFQPKVPPAVQMAHMGIGGTPGVAHHPYAQAPQGAPMMMQTPAGMVPMMPGHQAGGYVQTPQGLVQMVPMMMQPPGAPGQSYYQAPGQTNPPPPPPQ